MSLSNYPNKFDNNKNLYVVHDYLRLKLAEDYNPGDKAIFVYEDAAVMARFPGASEGGGIITLTDQCEKPEDRAISFTYSSKTNNSFTGVKIMPGFSDVKKYKDITHITQNVMAQHHNALKDSIIAIEKFAGLKGTKAQAPLTGTLEERINYLRDVVLAPKAWFSVDKRIGVLLPVPSDVCSNKKGLTVKFTDLSFRLGTDGASKKLKHTWFFNAKKINGKFDYNVSNYSSDEILTYETNIDGSSSTNNEITHTYCESSIYNVALVVENDFGKDTVVFENLINVKESCPDEAEIRFAPKLNQFFFNNRLRSATNTSIDITITSDGQTNDQRLKDPIVGYTWSIPDDLNHFNTNYTQSIFSVGGVYDVILRVDTKLGNYRITTSENELDIVEKVNLWLWTINDESDQVTSHEFGLISETFKTLSSQNITKIDNSFIKNTCGPDQYYYSENCRKLREFERNNGFSRIKNVGSGEGGEGLLYWSSGRRSCDPSCLEKINFKNYSGFLDCYSSAPIQNSGYSSAIARPWNWTSLSSDSSLYFLFGTTESIFSNQNIQKISSKNFSYSNSELSNYVNGSDELVQNSIYDTWLLSSGSTTTSTTSTTKAPDDCSAFSGSCPAIQYSRLDESLTQYDPTNPNHIREYYSSYRSVWRDGAGYILRNQNQGDFFRFRSFYKTSGTTSNQITGVKKINDLSGPVKTEGQLLNMSNGIFMFNNSGSVGVFNSTSNVWITGGPGTNSNQFRSMQDVNSDNFENQKQTLLGSSDGEHNAYLSYDYTENSFIKFNDIDLTFKYIGSRPSGKQWLSTIY